MLKNFTPRKLVETTQYELVFRLEDGCGSAFAFECDEHGNVYRDRLPVLALHNLDLCLKGEVDGYPVGPGVVRSYVQSHVEDGCGGCVCGQRVVITRSWANACGGCGREYNGSGQLLADRAFWGEETGESVTDMELEYDPEALGDW
jgi:hypothetical protein